MRRGVRQTPTITGTERLNNAKTEDDIFKRSMNGKMVAPLSGR